MNEQIKEIMGKTLDKHFSHTWTVMDYEDVNMFAEKFAELIVRECIDVCENGWAGEFTICGIRQCVEDLKKHFGVE